jgi:hypothetical protein
MVKAAEEKVFRKPHLPTKICQACKRPFAWRKKWRLNWDNVKTCSERCKTQLRRSAKNGDANDPRMQDQH